MKKSAEQLVEEAWADWKPGQPMPATDAAYINGTKQMMCRVPNGKGGFVFMDVREVRRIERAHGIVGGDEMDDEMESTGGGFTL